MSDAAKWLQQNVGDVLHEGVQKALTAVNPANPAPADALQIVADHLLQYVANQEAAEQARIAAEAAQVEADKQAAIAAEKAAEDAAIAAQQEAWQKSADNLGSDIKAKCQSEDMDSALAEIVSRCLNLTAADAAYIGEVGAGEEEEQLSYKCGAGKHASDVDISTVSVPKSKGVWSRAFPEPEGDEPAAPALVHVQHVTDEEGIFYAGGFRLGSFAAFPIAYDSSRSHEALLAACADLKTIEEQFATDTAAYDEAKTAYDENIAAHTETGYEEGEERPEEPVAPTRNDRQPLPTKGVKFVVGVDSLVSANKFSDSKLNTTHAACTNTAALIAEFESEAIFAAAEYLNNAEKRAEISEKLANAVAEIDAIEDIEPNTRFEKVCTDLLPLVAEDVSQYMASLPVLHDKVFNACNETLKHLGKGGDAANTRSGVDSIRAAFKQGALQTDAAALTANFADIEVGDHSFDEDDVAQNHPAMEVIKLFLSAFKDSVEAKKAQAIAEAEAAAAAAAEAEAAAAAAAAEAGE